jgi:hypothetical protein
MIKSRGMRWTEHVACMRERRHAYSVWWENLKAKGHVEELGVDGRVILQ